MQENEEEPTTIHKTNYMIAKIATSPTEPRLWSILEKSERDCARIGFCQQRKPSNIIQGFANRPSLDGQITEKNQRIVVENYDLELAAEMVYAATRSVEAYEAAGKEYIAQLIHDPKMTSTLKHMSENGYPDKHIKGEGVKQVIVMRNDLGMRKGKVAAQASHSSCAWLLSRLKSHVPKETWVLFEKMNKKDRDQGIGVSNATFINFTGEELEWMQSGQTKICVRVDSEEELIAIQDKALKSGLSVHLITDAGHTEFHGVPTKTCLAIGPHYNSRIDKITGHLSLL